MSSTRRLLAATAIAPVLWGTTYLVSTEFLPPDPPGGVSTTLGAAHPIIVTLLAVVMLHEE